MAVAPELDDVALAARGILDRHWPQACRIRSDAQLDDVWREAAAHGWLELEGDDALPLVLRLLDELGRAGCDLPVLDAFVAATLDPRIRTVVGDGAVVVTGPPAGGRVDVLAAPGLATHALVLGDGATLHRLEDVEPQPSIAPHGWASARLGPEELCAETTEIARRHLRLGLAARALGAATRAHELALAHARTREQFGRPIGSYQAVSHRAATCEIDRATSAALLADAAGRGTPLVAALAAAHTLDAAPRIVHGALHTLGGVGFHEEHEAAWLFRRVHADVVRARALASPAEEPSRLLIEERLDQPGVELGEAADAFRAEVRTFFDEHWDPGRTLDEDAQFDPELRALLVERGWLAAGWPRAWGGQERTPEELLALNEEVRYRGVPVRRLLTTVNLVGAAILRHSTEEQKRRFLPGIRTGETLFCLGYSEPGAGSDLASLRTAATKVDGGWRVDGQKIFTTFGHRSHYHWLAVRTSPDARPPHAGISVFIVPLDAPGITIQESRALNGETTTTTFYDDVFVPDDALVGEVDGGWRVIGTALSVERVQMGGNVAELRGLLDALLAAMRDDPELAGPPGSWQRQEVVALAAWLHAVRLFVVAGLQALAAGAPTRLPAAIAKVAGGEAAERLADVALRVLGPRAGLAAGARDAVANGAVERMLRLAPMYVIGGGTNDIQRNLIARELDLPRWRFSACW